jgi:hypothetical protein
MAKYDIQDESGNVVFTVEGDEPPTADDIEELMASQGGSPAPAAAPVQPSGKPGLLSLESALPGLVEAGKAAESGPAAPARAAVPNNLNDMTGGFGAAPTQGLGQAAKGWAAGAADIAGASFRLAGALIPSRITRGTTEDPTAPMGKRTRTFTEAVQNPEGSALTGLSEDIQNSDAPTAVKVAGKIALGVGEGGAIGAAKGVAGQTVKALLAKGAAPIADVAEGAAKYVQNVRMGTTASDINKGASAGNAMKHGLGTKTLKNALPLAEKKIKAWSEIRDGIYKKKSGRDISADDAMQVVEENINSKEFGVSERTAALQEIKDELERFASTTPKARLNQPSFTPRRPISQLMADELQKGVNAGEIKYNPKGGKFPFEYAKPEVMPEDGSAKYGIHLTLQEADKFKNWLQETGANFGKGSPRESAVSEKIFKEAYKEFTKKAELLGGEEYAKINKNLSEVIPIRNVLERTLKRSELGSDVLTKGGLIKNTANMAASATGLNRFGATAAYDASQGIKEAAQAPLRQAASQGAAEGFKGGAARGGLAGLLRR